MDKEKLKQNLQQIVTLAEECFAGLQIRRGPRAKKQSPAVPPPHSPKTLGDHILNLKAQGFFRQPKATREVHEKLQPQYPCEFKRVDTELSRLHKKKALRKVVKVINGKKVKAYVW